MLDILKKYQCAILFHNSPLHPLILQMLSLWNFKAKLLNVLCQLMRTFSLLKLRIVLGFPQLVVQWA